MDLNKISTTQAMKLIDYFLVEQRHGNFTDLDLSGIDWFDLSDDQRRKIWAMLYSDDVDNLTKMLFSLGAKIII